MRSDCFWDAHVTRVYKRRVIVVTVYSQCNQNAHCGTGKHISAEMPIIGKSCSADPYGDRIREKSD